MGRTSGLTEKQRVFTDAVVAGASGAEAARRAGFVAAPQEAYRLMRLPKVRDSIRERRISIVETDLAHIALSTMRELMTDAENVPAATRYKAAEWTLKAAGLAGADHAESRHDKPMEEMSGEELAQAISSGMDALREIAGALEGQHIVEGERRQLREIPADPDDGHIIVGAEEEEDASFLD